MRTTQEPDLISHALFRLGIAVCWKFQAVMFGPVLEVMIIIM